MNSVIAEDNEIKLEVLKKVQIGQLINYDEFLELYEPYKRKLSEIDFAGILGISYGNYMNIKNKNQRARIFKKKYVNISEEEKIQIEVLEKVQMNQSINYQEFIELYLPYQNKINEIDFASILGISYGNYMSIKNKGQRARIFKKKYVNISEEEKEKIQIEVLEKVQIGQSINYQEFIELYEPYQNKINEIYFASILGISYSSYFNIKNGQRARIFKNKYVNIIEKEKEKIQIDVLEKVQMYQSINYQEFLELYKPYQNKISEIYFASILGISYSSYINMKNCGSKTKALGYEIVTKFNRIKFLLKESRYYSKQELEEISDKFGLSISKILQLIFNFKKNSNNELYSLLEFFLINFYYFYYPFALSITYT